MNFFRVPAVYKEKGPGTAGPRLFEPGEFQK